jgi:uncharacterized protein (TIGR00288 family)
MGIRSDLQNQLRRLMNSDIIKGKVSVQRAYADWRRYPQYIVPLSEASIDLIFAPAFGANKKNATDIRLAIDALELIFTRPEIGTFILLSGDSDFSALVLKLKEYGKYVIGVGIRESSSDLLIQNCDEYFSYSELTGLAKQSDIEHVRRDPWELVVEAVQKMLHEGDVMRSDRLKQVMQAIDPKFDEKDAGFNRFSKFVVSAAQRGLLSLTKMDNGQYAIDLGANANVAVAHQAVAETASDESTRRKSSARRRDGHKRSESETVPRALTLSESFDLLKQALVAAGALGDESTDHERIRERMIDLRGSDSDPVFDSKRFVKMLRQAHDANLIELIKSDGDRYLLKLSGAETAGEPGAEDAATVDDSEAGAAEKKAGKTTKKKTARKKTARRTTTRRSARSTSSPAPEGEAESSDSDSGAVAAPDRAEAAEQAKLAPSEAKRATRKPRTAKRRSPRAKAVGTEPKSEREAAAPSGSDVSPSAAERQVSRSAQEPAADSVAQAAERSEQGAVAKARDAAESRSRPKSPAEAGAGGKPAKRNPRYRRGSRGAPVRPEPNDADAGAEREQQGARSGDRAHTTASSAPRTSGSRSLRMRRGSRGGSVTPEPAVTAAHEDVPQPSPPSGSPKPAVAEVQIEFSEPEATSSRRSLGEAAEVHEQHQGFLGKIRAAIHKAVGGDPQMPDSEG